jgi:hypothetical protein
MPDFFEFRIRTTQEKMFSIYEDEAEEMAIIRYSCLLKQLKTNIPKPKHRYIIEHEAKIVSVQQFSAALREGFIPKEGRTFIRRSDGVPEYTDFDGGNLTYYWGDKILYSIKLDMANCKVHPVSTDQICVGKVLRLDKSGRIQVNSRPCVCYPETFFTPGEEDLAKKYFTEALSRLELEESARVEKETAENARLQAEYSRFIEYLKLRSRVITLEPLTKLCPIQRLARPIKANPWHDRLRVAKPANYVTPDVSLFAHSELAVLEFKLRKRSFVLPKLSSPHQWTLNQNDSGLNWLSVSTVDGWFGFDLFTCTPCKPLPYQFDRNFARIEVTGRISRDDDDTERIYLTTDDKRTFALD